VVSVKESEAENRTFHPLPDMHAKRDTPSTMGACFFCKGLPAQAAGHRSNSVQEQICYKNNSYQRFIYKRQRPKTLKFQAKTPQPGASVTQ